MNEKIKQLANQARVLADQFQEQWKAGPSNEEFFQEKFAELIVRECIQAIQNESMNSSDEFEHGLRFAEGAILDHFGVEE